MTIGSIDDIHDEWIVRIFTFTMLERSAGKMDLLEPAMHAADAVTIYHRS